MLQQNEFQLPIICSTGAVGYMNSTTTSPLVLEDSSHLVSRRRMWYGRCMSPALVWHSCPSHEPETQVRDQWHLWQERDVYIYICFSRFWNKQETLKSLMSSFLDIFIRYEYVYLIVFMYCIQINHIDKIALDMIIYTYWCWWLPMDVPETMSSLYRCYHQSL